MIRFHFYFLTTDSYLFCILISTRRPTVGGTIALKSLRMPPLSFLLHHSPLQLLRPGPDCSSMRFSGLTDAALTLKSPEGNGVEVMAFFRREVCNYEIQYKYF